jgi:hypothetical protein
MFAYCVFRLPAAETLGFSGPHVGSNIMAQQIIKVALSQLGLNLGRVEFEALRDGECQI